MAAKEEVLRIERAALERWGRGDPDGFLEVTANDVTYFDPFLDRCIVGFEALASYYDNVRGKIWLDKFDIVDPRVQVFGDVAVLSYRFDSWTSDGSSHHWNATEVYRREPRGWVICHTHWALCAFGKGAGP